MSRTVSVLDQLTRSDFSTFVQRVFHLVSPGDDFHHAWHHEAIRWCLEEIEAGVNRRLIINVPPRSLKSIIVSVAWPAWLLGHDPRLRIVCVSYSGELAMKLARDCRRVMECAWYRRIFPGSLLSRRKAEHDFETVSGGGRFSTSVDGTLTGRGGSVVIIDDPMKAGDAYSEAERRKIIEFFRQTVNSRLNDKQRGSIVLVMQRLHEEDLTGHLLEDGGWKHICLPARAIEEERIQLGPREFFTRKPGDLLQPDREGEAALAALERSMGSDAFSAQYQQQPVPAGGVIIKRPWIRTYDQVPDGGQVVQSWDTASKDGLFNDYSVCVTARVVGNRVYLLDVHRAKLDFPELKAATLRLAKEWRSNAILIEDAASGTQLLQALWAEAPSGVPTPIRTKATADKVMRFAGQSHRVEAGDLLLPREAPWLASFLHELLGFPRVKFDDQADALVHLLEWTGRHPYIPSSPCGPELITPYDESEPTDWAQALQASIDAWGA